jgi:hypothetical protein
MTNSTTTATAPVQKSWKEQKELLKSKFPTITDADLRYDDGKKDEMLTRVYTKLGKTKEEFQTILSSL